MRGRRSALVERMRLAEPVERGSTPSTTQRTRGNLLRGPGEPSGASRTGRPRRRLQLWIVLPALALCRVLLRRALVPRRYHDRHERRTGLSRGCGREPGNQGKAQRDVRGAEQPETDDEGKNGPEHPGGVQERPGHSFSIFVTRPPMSPAWDRGSRVGAFREAAVQDRLLLRVHDVHDEERRS